MKIPVRVSIDVSSHDTPRPRASFLNVQAWRAKQNGFAVVDS